MKMRVSCYGKPLLMTCHARSSFKLKKKEWKGEGRKEKKKRKSKTLKKKKTQQVAVLIFLLLAISREWKKFKKQRRLSPAS